MLKRRHGGLGGEAPHLKESEEAAVGSQLLAPSQVLSLKIHAGLELFLGGLASFWGGAYRKNTNVTMTKMGSSTAPLYSM